MFAFLAAAAALTAAPDPATLIDSLVRLQGEYKKCLTEQTVALGASNAESAETVLRAVSSKCLPKETELRAAYALKPLPASQVVTLMARDRKLGEDAGVAALLEARAKRPQPNL